MKSRSPWGHIPPEERYASWVQSLHPGDEVAIGNSHDELTDIARVVEVNQARIRLENIPVQFWRVPPFFGQASGHQPPSRDGSIPYSTLLPVTEAYREWIAKRNRLRDESDSP